MKFKMRRPNEEGTIFASDSTVDVIGQPVGFEGIEIGKVIGYEIIDGELILECESDHPVIIEMFKGVIDEITS